MKWNTGSAPYNTVVLITDGRNIDVGFYSGQWYRGYPKPGILIQSTYFTPIAWAPLPELSKAEWKASGLLEYFTKTAGKSADARIDTIQTVHSKKQYVGAISTGGRDYLNCVWDEHGKAINLSTEYDLCPSFN